MTTNHLEDIPTRQKRMVEAIFPNINPTTKQLVVNLILTAIIQERERCARIAEIHKTGHVEDEWNDGTCGTIAAAIRTMEEQKPDPHNSQLKSDDSKESHSDS